VGFSFLPHFDRTLELQQEHFMAAPLEHTSSHLGSRINIDLVAIALGLALAALIRFNILPSIPF